MNASQRAWRWFATLTASVTGGSVPLFAWWSSLPVELRAALAGALVGLLGELWQVVKAALRARLERRLGIAPVVVQAPGSPAASSSSSSSSSPAASSSSSSSSSDFAREERELEQELEGIEGHDVRKG